MRANGIQVPVDLVYAMVCLGWCHGRLHNTPSNLGKKSRGKMGMRVREAARFLGLRTGAEAEDQHEDAQGKGILRSTFQTIHQMLTYHANPAATPKPTLPPSLLALLLTTFDLLTILILTLHTIFFFTALRPNLLFCYTPAARAYPSWAFHDSSSSSSAGDKQEWRKPPWERKTQLSLVERCERVNWNMWVAGGFGTAGVVVVGGLHAVMLGVRAWEGMRRLGWFGGGKGGDEGVMEGEGKGGGEGGLRDGDDDAESVEKIDDVEKTAGVGLRRRTGLQKSQRGQGGSRASDDERRESTGDKWVTAFLECLVP